MTREDEVRSEDFLKDFRSGMTRQELMKKYKLTPRGLDTLSKDLVHIPGAAAGSRTSSRKHVGFVLPISVSDDPENTGLVYDISEDGIGARGLRVKVHDIRTFVIPADDFFRVEPVVFQGLCRWVEEKDDRWESAAGFKVIKVLQGNLTELQAIARGLGR